MCGLPRWRCAFLSDTAPPACSDFSNLRPPPSLPLPLTATLRQLSYLASLFRVPSPLLCGEGRQKISHCRRSGHSKISTWPHGKCPTTGRHWCSSSTCCVVLPPSAFCNGASRFDVIVISNLKNTRIKGPLRSSWAALVNLESLLRTHREG